MRVGGRSDVNALRAFHTDFHLLDGAGGKPFDWALVAERGTDIPLILAGGLTPDNVADAIAATEPFAVDVATGVEASAGRKDPAKVAAFAEAARAHTPAAA